MGDPLTTLERFVTNISECTFGAKDVDYLGHQVSCFEVLVDA